MIHTRLSRCALLAAVAGAIGGCYRQPTMTATLPPVLPREIMTAPPAATRSATSAADTVYTTREPRVTVDTHGRAVDVRPLLDFVATRAGISFVYAPEIEKKIQAHLIDVPVSVALKALLTSAGLTLESVQGEATVPSTPSVVFYQLPVNVDSLSVDAIMKRFGVGRAVAEMIVQARVKP